MDSIDKEIPDCTNSGCNKPYNEEDFRLSELDGYNEVLELEREKKFREFSASCDATEQRNALESMASLTALRSATFISAHEIALGIHS